MKAKNTLKLMTVKQRRYVDCYDGDIKRSAKEAGISYVYAKELHAKTCYAYVLGALKKRNEEQSKKTIMSRQQRQEFWSKMTKEAEKDSDKLKASELLGRSEADFTDKLGIGGIGKDGEITAICITLVRPKEIGYDGD